jgi:hypothetical protein
MDDQMRRCHSSMKERRILDSCGVEADYIQKKTRCLRAGEKAKTSLLDGL